VTAVAAGGAAANVGNTATNGNDIQPFFIPDSTGAKVLVFTNTNSTAKVYTVSGGASTTISTNVNGGFLSDDGNTIYFHTTANAFKKAATNAGNNPTATTLIATDLGELDVSKDKSHFVYASQTPAGGGSGELTIFDLQLADTTTANQTPVALDATVTGLPGGFTADNMYVAYMTDLTTTNPVGKLRIRPVAAGGAEKVVSSTAAAPRTMPAGSKVLFLDNLMPSGMSVTADVKVVDAAGAGTTSSLVADATNADFEIAGTKIVFTRSGANAGIWAADVP
jgi:hypothetical protein